MDLPCVHRISPCVFAPEEEKEEVGSKVTDALGENFEKHDKIAKIHQGAVNGGLPAFYVACKLIMDALFRLRLLSVNNAISSDGEDDGDDDDGSADGEEAENGEKEKNGEGAKDEKAESDVEGGEKEGEDQSAQVESIMKTYCF